MFMDGVQILDGLLYTYFSVCVCYLLVFTLSSFFHKETLPPHTGKYKRFLILIPGYKEDKVIIESVQSALSQNYPSDAFHVLVISDHMSDDTNATLRSMNAEVLEIKVAESSKSLALQKAVQHTSAPYDYAVILDADNLIAAHYLEQANNYIQETGCRVLQTHRTAKNLNTPTAVLDAAIEEMNNSIFRLGHVQLGFSSALIGSGMVMDYSWFAENIFHTHTAGEDKELEELLLRQHIHIHYADHIRVLDEKVQQKTAMSNQRKRWIATQFFLAGLMWPKVPQALLQGNGDYIVKAVQSIILPRSILVAFAGIMCLLTSVVPFLVSGKWWILLFVLLFTLYLAIPQSMRNSSLFHAIKEVPFFIVSMVQNLFRSKGASQKFIHTSHG